MTNLPLTGKFRITAYFKQINSKLWKTLGFHTGLDFVGADNIYATCNGIVDSVNYSNAYGNYIIIKEDNANRYHYFCHLKSVNVAKGNRVNRETIIGIMGSTGNVTGKHLHYEIRQGKALTKETLVNPAEYCKIPNSKGTYDSNNYQLNSNTLKNGDIVEIDLNIGVCCPVNDNFLLCDNFVLRDDRRQFEVHKSVVKNNNRLIARATVCSVDGNDVFVQVFDDINGRQFWVAKSCVKLLKRA